MLMGWALQKGFIMGTCAQPKGPKLSKKIEIAYFFFETAYWAIMG